MLPAITERLTEALEPDATLTLPFELRRKSRLRVRLDNGAMVGLFLPRGTVLRQNDLLRADTGLVVRVNAAPEAVSMVSAPDPVLLARACYHLGNRHISVQIGNGWLRYLHDPVLDAMLVELGLLPVHEQAPFEPEAGAYEVRHHHDDE